MTYEPSSTENVQTPVNPNVATNKKTLKIAGAIIGVIILLAVIGGGSGSNSSNSNNNDNSSSQTWDVPTTVSVADQWSAWKSDFMPLVSQTQTHYTQTQADLSNYDVSASMDDFTTLSDDALQWITYNNSPNAEVNRLVTAVSVDLQMIASQGVLVLSGDTSDSAIADFQTYCRNFGRDTDALATAISKANETF